MQLITKEEWSNKLTPTQQGYAVYMQGEHPGSELKGLTNPYAEGTRRYLEFENGQMRAVLDAQDSED